MYGFYMMLVSRLNCVENVKNELTKLTKYYKIKGLAFVDMQLVVLF
ncbi:MAG: hypothetical protein ACOYI4_06660 [Christensenellales bacterium]|jgi:hypothetical protein